MDLTLRVATLPRPGETVLSAATELRPGGKGANQAVACALAGSSVQMAGRTGDDAHGATIRSALARAGVDVERLTAVADEPTGMAVVIVDAAGENMIAVSPGANHVIAPAEVEELLSGLHDVAVLLMQLELPAPVVVRAIEWAGAAGARVILNLAPAAELPTGALAGVDVLVVNRSEAEFLLGRPLAGLTALGPAAHDLRGLGPRAVVITLGEDGAVFHEGDGAVHVPAAPVDAVDTVGAGDAFVGVLAARLSLDEGLAAAVRAATLAAAQAVRTPGAQLALGLDLPPITSHDSGEDVRARHH